jgi:hypothetical protein
MIPACKLWEKVSAKGNRYLIGRMGGVRVMVMTNTRPEDENDASHVLMFAEAPQYYQSQAAPAESSHPAAQREDAADRGRSGAILSCAKPWDQGAGSASASTLRQCATRRGSAARASRDARRHAPRAVLNHPIELRRALTARPRTRAQPRPEDPRFDHPIRSHEKVHIPSRQHGQGPRVWSGENGLSEAKRAHEVAETLGRPPQGRGCRANSV